MALPLVGVWAAAALSFLAVGAVLPVLPRYVRGPVGAGDVAVGVVVGAFAFTAVVGRPVAGRLADAHGRRTVMAAGALVTAVAGALYFLPAGVPGLVVARLVLGVGEALVFTAGVAWAVDLAPVDRRGQVIGLFGLAIWMALTVGPLTGEVLRAELGFDAVWAFAAGVPLLGALVVARLPTTAAPGAPAARPRLLPPGIARLGVGLALANVGYAAMAAFVVLHLEERGVGGGAVVFTAFAAAVVGTRLVAGRLPDRLGARPTALAAFAAESAGLAILAAAGSLPVAVAGAVVMGTGFSVLFPALALLVLDDADEGTRGGALGTFTAFFDAGVGIGGPLAGAVSALAGYPAAFWVSAGAAAAGGVLVLGRRPGGTETGAEP